MKLSYIWPAMREETRPPQMKKLLALSDKPLPAAARKDMLNSSAPLQRESAVRMGDLTEQERRAALADENKFVRMAAVELGNLTPEQLEKALTDPSRHVRQAAVVVSRLNADQIDRATRDKDYLVRWAALEAGPITDAQLTRLVVDLNPYVRVAAIDLGAASDRLSMEQIEFARHDPNPSVRGAANHAFDLWASPGPDYHGDSPSIG